MFDSRINKSKAWKKLESHCKSMRKVLMRDLFEKDSKRAQKFTESLDDTIIHTMIYSVLLCDRQLRKFALGKRSKHDLCYILSDENSLQTAATKEG